MLGSSSHHLGAGGGGGKLTLVAPLGKGCWHIPLFQPAMKLEKSSLAVRDKDRLAHLV